jgi:ParB family chromosome partitioning protein
VTPKINLPSDFAKQICQSLGVTEKWVDEWFDIEEDKQGYFIAKLKPKKFLEKQQFRTLCALARDLGGEGYLQGMKAWKVPGPYAGKPVSADTTTTPSLDGRSKPQPTGPVAPDSLTYDRSKPPDIPNLKFILVDAVKIPDFLPTRTLISNERLSEIRDSIKKHGLKYPIKVRRAGSDYQLIDGYLRLKSVQQLGWKGILAEIKEASDEQVITESIITNKHRIEEDPITIAKKMDILVNAFGYTQEKLAEELGATQSWVSNTLRLLKLPTEIQHYFAVNNVSFHHGLLLLTLENPDLQVQLAKEIVDNNLSTRQLEQRIREVQPRPVAPIAPIAPSPPEETEESQPSPVGFEPTHEAPATETMTEREEVEEREPEPPTQFHEPIGPGPEPIEPKAEQKPEAIDIGTFECPECHEHFIVEHVSNNLHRLRKVPTIESERTKEK